MLGGRTDSLEDPSFTYSSAAISDHLLALDLSSSFDTSGASSRWSVIGNASVGTAWGTMGILSQDQAFVFGGDGGSAVALSTRNDSCFVIDGLGVPSAKFSEVSSYQPMRRLHASSALGDGVAYVMGGEKADGSGLGFEEVWRVTSADGLVFQQLASLPTALTHHQSVLLPNGTLLVLGGYETRMGSMASMSTAWTLDTTREDSTWQTVSLDGEAAPQDRRGHALVSIGEKALLFGGSSSRTSIQAGQALGDLWELDLESGKWTELPTNGAPSARLDMSAAAVNGRMVVFGGETHQYSLCYLMS